MTGHPPAVGAFEARPASSFSRLVHKASSILTEGGDEIVLEQKAPAWALRDAIYNRAWSDKILAGNVVAMAFCATWCVLCQWEVDAFRELHMKYAARGLRIMGIFLDFPHDIRTFALIHQIANRYHCCAATDKVLWDYGVYPTGRIPYLALINRDGTLRQTFPGYHPKASYEAAFVKALAP